MPRKEFSMRQALVVLASTLALSMMLVAGCGKSSDAPAGGSATPASPPASAASG
jgi:hypothetical protein